MHFAIWIIWGMRILKFLPHEALDGIFKVASVMTLASDKEPTELGQPQFVWGYSDHQSLVFFDTIANAHFKATKHNGD